MGEPWRAGDVVASRELRSAWDAPVPLPAATGLTHLQFRRFAGCPICTVHLGRFVSRRAEIAAAGITEVVVFHSPVEALRSYHDDVPFACVADPAGALYDEFGVASAPKALLHPKAWLAYGRGVVGARSLLGSLGEDDHLGLPADLLIRPDGTVVAAGYGRHADDGWSVDDLLSHARRGSVAGR